MFSNKKKKKNNDKENIIDRISRKYRLVRYFELVLGCLLVAIGFNLFLLPNDIIFGGVSGLSIVLNHLFNVEPSNFIMISSLFLLVVSYFLLGKEKTKGSLIGSIIFPIFVDLTANIGDYIEISHNQLLLSVLFGAVLYGFGTGLVFRAGFTTGGSDILNQIVAKYCHVSLGTSMLMSDGIIVASGFFVFGATKLMYAVLGIYIISIITDKILLGISSSKAFYIITDKDEEIKKYILEDLGHGVTIFDAKGGYAKEKQKVLLSVIPTSGYYRLKEGIHEIDSEAFFVVTDAYEVFGGE